MSYFGLFARRFVPWMSVLLLFVCLNKRLNAQTSSASLDVAIADTTGAVVSAADVVLRNTDTNQEQRGQSRRTGTLSFQFLKPGHYALLVSKANFADVAVSNIILNVGDDKTFQLTLKVGSNSQTVTVDGSGQTINTTDASVGTVVDRQFVGNMPLNGRSFQSLIMLAPGVVTTSPQNGTNAGVSGEFSVNGQRTDANSYSVDGLSANNGVSTNGGTPGSAGTLASFSALGTTQALVSIDALQEFRITTSTYSAEYGRQPGAQVEFQTRSGTNDFHGTLFDYFRNDALDANNWFNDDNRPIIAKPAERQNDFGGVLGGPIDIPKLYSGIDRAFFFLSYEGLRLSQPQPAEILYVPSNGTNSTTTYPNPQYANLRANAPLALQPVLKAYPLPNCTIKQNPQCVDYGDGLSPYIVSTSLPSRLDSISGRFDYQAAPWLRLFVRYADTTSSAVTSATTSTATKSYRTQTVNFGGDSTFSATTSNQFRLGYSPTHGISTLSSATTGGAIPVDLRSLQPGTAPAISELAFDFPNGESAQTEQGTNGAPQHQWNLVDTVSWSRGSQVFKAGIDYRRTTSYVGSPGLSSYPLREWIYDSAANVLQNNANVGLVLISSEQDPAFTNFSAFLQDEWRIHPRISLSMGVRWELNPPPSVVGGVQQRTLDGSFSDPASLTLAPIGTPLYKTTYYNFAPRLGLAATLHDHRGRETVFRAGGGVYFDTGQNFEFYGAGESPGLGTTGEYIGSSTNLVPFPFTPTQQNIVPSLATPYQAMVVVSRSLQLPYTFQWNASLEQAFGVAQTLTLGYIGSNGRRLLALQPYNLGGVNPEFSSVRRYQNGLSSSYNSLQLQFKRTLTRGLQALVAYTWSHALDYESLDTGNVPYQRGNSDNDVRDNFTIALSYDLPSTYQKHWVQAGLGGWGSDLRFTTRTAFPVELNGPEETDLLGNQFYSALNYNGANPYVYKAGIPGGRQYNPVVFSVPLTGQNGNSPRNFLRGFGEDEVNLALRREFPIYEKIHLQFRAEAFNLLNHPNFGRINSTCGAYAPGAICTNPLLGQATNTLAGALGGGLTQLYQQGGPRSLQLSLKLTF